MRRIKLTDQELDRVIKLRQVGASWLRIQRETGIPRRVAKRVYEEWEQIHSWEFLQAARRDVAADEFRDHLNEITGLAQSLVDALKLPISPNETRTADLVLEEVWQREIRAEPELHVPIWEPGNDDRRRRQIIRRNRKLFDSLKEHTEEKVRWQALEDWKDAWNNCINILGSLRKEAQGILSGFLKQKPTLRQRVENVIEKSAIDAIVEGVMWTTWPVPAVGESEKESTLVHTRPRPKGAIAVVFGQREVAVGLRFSDEDLAQEVRTLCEQIAQIVSQGDWTERLEQAFHMGEASIIELEEMLDPLMLRPLILRTRCDLCPV